MKQSEKSENTKNFILEKAFNSVYKTGYEVTNPKMIMNATGLSKGAFYHHFKNKEDITVQMIDTILHQRIYHNMIQPLYHSGNSIEILKEVFINRLTQFNEEEKALGCPLNNLVNEIGTRNQDIKAALSRIINEWKMAIVYILDRGKVENTVLNSVNTKAVATFLICGFEGVRGIRKVENNDEVFKEFLESTTAYLDSLKQTNWNVFN